MYGWPILSIVTFMPLIGAIFLLFFPKIGDSRRVVLIISLAISLLTFFLSVIVWVKFNNNDPRFQMIEYHKWIDPFFDYHLGIDGISVLFVILSAFLIPFCILASSASIKERFKEYVVAFLILESMVIGVFVSLDIVLFYLFFEASLVPMFIIIGRWGGPDRVYASYKFFIYTFLGSVLMLLAIMAMYWETRTTDVLKLLEYNFSYNMQFWLFLAFLCSFAVKIPMWPIHTWLPDAHVQAPTAGSVVLAGVMLKLGGYGLLRFCLPIFPLASDFFAPIIFVLSVIAIIYASLVAMVQEDIKKLIAYSSVAHMGYVTMGIFSANIQGVQGSVFQMLSHGIISSALFLCIGIIYDRLHTRQISSYGGVAYSMPKYAVSFMVFTMANIGLPGTSGFIGEFLTLMGVFKVSSITALFAGIGIILSASYGLWVYRRVIFGPLINEKIKLLFDLSLREKFVLYPMIILIIFFGVYPFPILKTTSGSIDLLLSNYHAALQVSRDFMPW
ncbi:NADH-ubiquinone oxidoreductase chain M [Liberibacter crescens BT-1]|uniref:NADH-ubiquinone oxidoreductase chain M n=1 Tax=Liberibacter crescens (strain BT-1) TaxID=1215343 RepID=L0ETH8_LIBCB|nr:NADH-quinone oxidoreductase subunit M [Liberibacter crescens]AGA64262.1 NADH-ubiquinone oxidoreductase chain M [Liberibacter crescens BT-1]AMC12498.1 NADH-quinone oxidoreductase chain 13 [Liberibacter crescens]